MMTIRSRLTGLTSHGGSWIGNEISVGSRFKPVDWTTADRWYERTSLTRPGVDLR